MAGKKTMILGLPMAMAVAFTDNAINFMHVSGWIQHSLIGT
jgi:hypothetical protein